MKRISQFILLTIFSVCSMSVYAEITNDKTAGIVKQSISTVMQQYHIPGMAVELYVEGKPYAYYFGYANQTKKIPVSAKTIFELGSLSKLMTSLLLAQEIDIAKMNLSDPITKYLPDLSQDFSDINLQSLATHTSGLPFTVPKEVTTVPALHQYLAHWSPDDAPGEQWLYSNFGIGMLGYALENSTHHPFNQLYRRHILNPLGMQAIGTQIPRMLKKYAAQGYDENGNAVRSVETGVFPTAYAVKASANDMQHFLSAAIGLPGTSDRIFYPMRMTQTAYVQIGDKMQGLGWQIQDMTSANQINLLHTNEPNIDPIEVDEIYDKPTFNGDALIDKTGSTNGFRAYIAVIPNKKSGIVMLANKYVPMSVIVDTAREILFKTTT
ncbi:MAG: serine hydrolase [Gammaproteobacteria bacterium]|nr:serine hydrolase [Gammaproteobacteria bacterium]